ncbi:MAG: methyl-accepting chemotaxis protein [Synergistetes bacterium]|nr:methyl-accepting chemotaxis protein [Synergistota bacterium]
MGIATGVNIEEILSPISYLQRKSLLVGGIISLVFLIIGFIIGNSIVNPIRRLMALAQRAASGDLSFSIPKLTKDEVGELCESLDSMMKSLKDVISNLTKRSLRLDESSSILLNICDETAKALSTTSGRIVEITENTKKQTEELHQASETLSELAHTVESAYQNAKITREASDKAENASIKIKEASQHLIESMNEIRNEVLSTAEAVKKLGERSREINKIVDLITNIAEQTNLLALNAAIEAARAGEAGRGFAVVAEEVRKLAEASGQAAMQISNLINEIREDTEFAVEKMRKSSEAVERGASLATEASSAVEAIISAVNETKKFIDELEEIIFREVETSKKVVKTINEVNLKAEENSQAIEDVSASAEEITASSEEVASAASELKEISASIKEIISQFKIEETQIKEVGK